MILNFFIMKENLLSRINNHDWSGFISQEFEFFDYIGKDKSEIERLTKIFAFKVSSHDSYFGTIEYLRSLDDLDLFLSSKTNEEFVEELMIFEKMPGIHLYGFVDKIESYLKENVFQGINYLTRKEQYKALAKDLQNVKVKYIESGNSIDAIHQNFLDQI